MDWFLLKCFSTLLEQKLLYTKCLIYQFTPNNASSFSSPKSFLSNITFIHSPMNTLEGNLGFSILQYIENSVDTRKYQVSVIIYWMWSIFVVFLYGWFSSLRPKLQLCPGYLWQRHIAIYIYIYIVSWYSQKI